MQYYNDVVAFGVKASPLAVVYSISEKHSASKSVTTVYVLISLPIRNQDKLSQTVFVACHFMRKLIVDTTISV